MGTSTCLLSTPSNPAVTPLTTTSQSHHQNHYLTLQFRQARMNKIYPFLLVPMKPKSSSATCVSATLKSPKGFGAPPPRRSKKKGKRGNSYSDEEDEEENEEDEERSNDEGIIPEIVTNRMMSRMAFSVDTPLFIGLLFFPFFYYLKVGLKIDVPNWVPFIVSFFFFGSALLGVSYGIESSSWDPLREGSLLGWNEAQKNWPVFWQSISGGGSKSKK